MSRDNWLALAVVAAAVALFLAGAMLDLRYADACGGFAWGRWNPAPWRWLLGGGC